MSTVSPKLNQKQSANCVIEYWARQYNLRVPQYLIQQIINFMLIIIKFVQGTHYVDFDGPDDQFLNVASIYDDVMKIMFGDEETSQYEYAYTNAIIDFQDTSIIDYEIIFKILNSSVFNNNKKQDPEFIIGICRENRFWNTNQEMTSFLSYIHKHLKLGDTICISIDQRGIAKWRIQRNKQTSTWTIFAMLDTAYVYKLYVKLNSTQWNKYLPNQYRSIMLVDSYYIQQQKQSVDDDDEQMSYFLEENSKLLGQRIFNLSSPVNEHTVSKMIHSNSTKILLPFIKKMINQSTKN